MDLKFQFQFQDWLFLPFFAAAWAVYLLIKGTRFRNAWLVIASYAFYAAWSPIYIAMMAYATLFDYFVTMFMEKSSRKKLWVTLSVINNVGLIAFFKYARFITENINELLPKLHISGEIWTPSGWLLMPMVGLSFYIFKSLGYVIDCYRGTVQRERNIITYAAFVSFFPMLIAGPIERAGNLLAQLRTEPPVKKDDIADGLSLFVTGLFKKLVLADGLALFVAPIYRFPDTPETTGTMLLAATFAFAWQIYFDFSGYSDMARGVARLFGFKILLNFNNPYLATGLSDFWRRWHMTLSFWFRDYVYIPLGGNRKGEFRTYFNLFITMVISGMWHNPGWTFIAWGAVHGLGSCLTRALERSTFYKDRIPALPKQFGCFLIVCFGWIFFNAKTWADACVIVKKIFTSGFTDPRFPLVMLGAIAVAWIYQFVYESRFNRIVNAAPVRLAIVVVMLLLTFILAGASQAFVYEAF